MRAALSRLEIYYFSLRHLELDKVEFTGKESLECEVGNFAAYRDVIHRLPIGNSVTKVLGSQTIVSAYKLLYRAVMS